MVFFGSAYTMRRYEKDVIVNGYSAPGTYTDSTVTLDVQSQYSVETPEDPGSRDSFTLKVFSDFAFRVSNQEEGVRADLIYYEGRWFEAAQCRESKNVLPHWTSLFTLVPRSTEPDPWTDTEEEEDDE